MNTVQPQSVHVCIRKVDGTDIPFSIVPTSSVQDLKLALEQASSLFTPI